MDRDEYLKGKAREYAEAARVQPIRRPTPPARHRLAAAVSPSPRVGLNKPRPVNVPGKPIDPAVLAWSEVSHESYEQRIASGDIAVSTVAVVSCLKLRELDVSANRETGRPPIISLAIYQCDKESGDRGFRTAVLLRRDALEDLRRALDVAERMLQGERGW